MTDAQVRTLLDAQLDRIATAVRSMVRPADGDPANVHFLADIEDAVDDARAALSRIAAEPDTLDGERLALCQLLPKGSPERDAANSTRLSGSSVVPFIEAHLRRIAAEQEALREALRQVADATRRINGDKSESQGAFAARIQGIANAALAASARALDSTKEGGD